MKNKPCDLLVSALFENGYRQYYPWYVIPGHIFNEIRKKTEIECAHSVASPFGALPHHYNFASSKGIILISGDDEEKHLRLMRINKSQKKYNFECFLLSGTSTDMVKIIRIPPTLQLSIVLTAKPHK